MTPVYYSILEQLLLTGFYYSLEREAAHCLDRYSLFKVGVVVVVVAGWKTGCGSQFAMLIRTSKEEYKMPSPAAVRTLTGGVVTRPMNSLCKLNGVAQRRCCIISSSELYFERTVNTWYFMNSAAFIIGTYSPAFMCSCLTKNAVWKQKHIPLGISGTWEK